MQFADALEDANLQNDGTFGFVVSPKTKAKLKAIPCAVNFPKYLWEGRPGREAVGLGQYGGYVSKLMDENLVGQVLFAQWSQCMICNWAGIDFLSDPYTLADNFLVRIAIHMLVDVEWRHNIAASASTDSGAQ